MIKIVATGIVWFIIGFYFGFIFDNNFVEDSCEEIKQSQSPFTYAAPKCLKKGSVVELEASEANFKDGVWRVEYSTGENVNVKIELVGKSNQQQSQLNLHLVIM